ncbi:HpcH/HpaI aldolase/citrate lyase family protein [Acinetobacter rudis]|uniref:Citrate lyase subunit beta/citryl-CoA lyase n=1 Tax=Acinetobacter rudis CIP 110305 TaxID=421052 RepID=S3MX74_9GAMM|nr:CoA ester lyase [Acinetobacter rudis]EPF71023.1 citrate lyase subunit beta/citryl-CoA lyase [Acinetobacter rudis CIP 110305]
MQKIRSMLFVPANRPERYSKALNSGSDAVIIDLEDAVPEADKITARVQLKQWLIAHPEQQVMIRVNADQTPWFTEDILLAQYANVCAIVLAKAEQERAFEAIKSIRNLAIYPIIETPYGMAHVEEIAGFPAVQALIFGSIDFQLEMQMTGDALELMYFRNRMVLASKLAGIAQPIDGVTADFSNLELLSDETIQAKKLGFQGKLCIHPKQVDIVQQVFKPSFAEVQWAKEVLAAVQAAQGQTISLNGKMIDKPIISQAEKILQQLD